MSDGSKLRQSWSAALNDAETLFRQLLTSPANEWKRVTTKTENTSPKKGKAKASSLPELTDVVVHRKTSKTGDDIYRLVLEVPLSEDFGSLEPWKAVLSTPELRQEWDPAVEEAHLLEVFDHSTRIAKTNFTLGWPANPRDAVTISRTYYDAMNVIDITTSLPRSPDEPAYLRPSPPFVRSHIPLFAWCIQLMQPPPSANPPNDKKKLGKVRTTCFWQHDLKSMWGFGSSSNLTQQLSTMILGLFKTVLKRGTRVPKLIGYGNGVSIERLRFQIDRQALTIDYSIVPDDDPGLDNDTQVKDVQVVREHRRLTRAIECLLPLSEGWDVRVTTKASSEEVEQLPWSAHAIRSSSSGSSSQNPSVPPDHIVFRLSHAALLDDHSILKVKVVIEISGPSSGLRLNGLPQAIQDVEDRDPLSYFMAQKTFQDVPNPVEFDFQSTSSMNSVHSSTSMDSAQALVRQTSTERTAAADKSILSRVRRNYIYFSSLLQEPEAKWRRTTEGRGVAITQLDSIDPTLVVYRAEATFVGVGLWDLFGAVVSPGAKIYWDKQHEDAALLEDVNELTELWHYKTRPAWPVNGRDAVVLKTVYKSPTAIHVFSFSAEDPNLFPSIPPVEPNVIRTQVDLQGWAIEALSPTTTMLTLLEQSDPKGWANKTAIPTQMINLLAGIGEFAIKCGGPPVMTRLAGAKANELRYDHERSSFRIEYEASASRRTTSTSSEDGSIVSPTIECELRCDLDTWAHSLDIVVDPPPQSISCLRRHRLSAEGGGLWITMAHDAMFVDEDRLLAIVRRAPGKEKGIVMINGAKVPVDVEELPEADIKLLTKQKRVKPPRIPLDQPPVMAALRRRNAEWDADSEGATRPNPLNTTNPALSAWASAPRLSSPLTRFFNYAVDQATTTTQQAMAAISPAVSTSSSATPSSSKAPMQYALDALAWTQEMHATVPSTGWQLVSEKGLPVHKKVVPEICSAIPVYKGFKVIEGVSAEELASVIMEPDCQKKWDDRYDSSFVLESFGSNFKTSFVISKAGFPWRDRGFYVASVMARAAATSTLLRTTSQSEVTEQSNSIRNAVFCVSASFCQDSVAKFSPAKYNSYLLPIGRLYLDAWILETLDPYTTENYAIPSTRCTRLVAVDYAGAIPAAVNTMINSTLPRAILAVETFIKGLQAPHPVTRLPAPGMVITDKKVEGHLALASTAWKLRKRDESRVLVSTRYKEEARVYVATIFIPPTTSRTSSPNLTPPTTTSNTEQNPVEQTPRISRLQLGSTTEPNENADSSFQSDNVTVSKPQTALLSTPRSSHIRSSSITSSPVPSSPPPPISPLRGRSASSSSPPTSTSFIRGRTLSSAFTIKGEVKQPVDLIVGEVVVDSKLYPEGYDVVLRSRLRKESGNSTLRGTKGKASLLAKVKVRVDGKDALVVGEKESLTSLGRDGLLDDRVSKMGVLSRIPSESEPLPEELKLPIGIADELLDIESTSSKTPDDSQPIMELPAVAEDSEKVANNANDQDAASSPSILTPRPAHVAASGGLLGFLNTYNTTLARFSLTGTNTTPTIDTNTTIENNNNGNGNMTSNNSEGKPSAAVDAESRPKTTGSPTTSLPGGLREGEGVASTVQTRGGQFPLSTVLVVALIAFLIGSLLRSLLSPAEFMYFITDEREIEGISGWREIRRLVEIKYLVGGWDLQVAVSGSSQPTPPQLDSSPQTLSWEGEKMFNIYIYDYCFKRGFRKTARELMAEAEISPDSNPPINARQGLLFEWWSVFWVLFTAKASGVGTDEALIYTQHQANQLAQRQASQRMQPPPGQAPPVGQPPNPGMPLQQPPMGRAPPNGVTGRPGMIGFPGNGPMSNGVGPPPGSLQPGGPNTFMTQPNGIPGPSGPPLSQGMPSGQGQGFQPMPPGGRPAMGGMPNQQPQSQQHPQGQRGPNPNGPFPSPNMTNSHSPQNQPGPQQHPMQHIQPPMGQPGPSTHLSQLNRGGMLPPNQGMNPMNPQGPLTGGAPQYPQIGRSPSRAATPSQGQGGMIHQSPSLANRQPPGPGNIQMPPGSGDSMNAQLMSMPQALVNQITKELNIEGKDISTFTMQDKTRILSLYRSKYMQPQPGNPGGGPPENAAAGPSNPMMQMPNQQQAQRIPQQRSQLQQRAKRNSTSPGEEHESLPHDSSPPANKRVRRSPMEPPAVPPTPNYNPQQQPGNHPQQHGGMMINGPQGMMPMRGPPGPMGMNGGGPGGPPPGQPLMGSPMNLGGMGMGMGPVSGTGPGPGGPGPGPQPPMMQNLQHMGGPMPPQMGPPGGLTPHMQNQQMQAREAAMRHQQQVLPKGAQPGGLAMNAGSPPSTDPSQFNLGGQLPIGGPGPGFNQNRMAKGMGPPPSPALNGPPKDQKPPLIQNVSGNGKNPMQNPNMAPANHSSPRNPPASGPPGNIGQNGPGPSTPAPQNAPQPNNNAPPPPSSVMGGPQSMAPSPSAILGGVGDAPSMGLTNQDIFSNDFIQSVAGSLDFDPSFLQPPGDINFERDFGQWFNPDDAMTGLDMK
ncbi:hypothetical protein H0H93_007431 [Arthromyces matolae]|nr:hypothetical protein H0H93_007431 [Arthromyces matolae]